jgi:hypothetical protein
VGRSKRAVDNRFGGFCRESYGHTFGRPARKERGRKRFAGACRERAGSGIGRGDEIFWHEKGRDSAEREKIY